MEGNLTVLWSGKCWHKTVRTSLLSSRVMITHYTCSEQVPLLSPLAHVLGSLSIKRLEAGSLRGRWAAGGCVTRSAERGPAAPPPLQAALFVPAPEADPPAVSATRRWRLAVIVAIFMPQSHLEGKVDCVRSGPMYFKYSTESYSFSLSSSYKMFDLS